MVLSDIEICQRVAEIEGFKIKVWQPYKGGSTNPDYKFVEAKGFDPKNKSPWNNVFNPISNDDLCFKLIVKHGLVRKYVAYDCMGWYYTDRENDSLTMPIREGFLVSEYGENRAALLAIIEKHKASLQE